jgi:hypothetical protein
VYFRQVKTAKNCSDHFTKALPLAALREHCSAMMGLRFITPEHAKLVQLRKCQDNAK